MIPAKLPLHVGKTYIHSKTKMVYKIQFITDKVKLNGVWVNERFITYSRLAETETFGRFEPDFKHSFTMVA